MDVNKATEQLHSLIPDQPIYGVSNVASNMAERRLYYDKAGFEQFNSFALSYHYVTMTIEDKLDQHKIWGEGHFRQPQVLDTAIGIFDHKFATPIKRQLEGKPVPVHWNVPLNHELMFNADKGIQAVIGYICHITSRDLPETVYETEQSGLYDSEVMRDYVKYDYDKINESLARSAKKLAPQLIESQNPRTRDALVKLAMAGVVMGRKLAIHDYRRLARAKSIDHRESIMNTADHRAAKLATFILEKSYSYQGLRNQFKKPSSLNPAA